MAAMKEEEEAVWRTKGRARINDFRVGQFWVG